MKLKLLSIVALSAVMLNASVYAEDKAPVYYSAHFEVVSVKAMCPATVPNGAVCMGIGSIVTLSATLGCADSLVYSEVEDRAQSYGAMGEVDLYVVSVVKQHPKYADIRCHRANKVTKVITVPYNTLNYNVVNLAVEASN